VKRLSLALAGLAVLLALPGLADAKELSAVKICGSSGCKRVTNPQLLRTLIRAVEAQGDPISVPTPAPNRFLRLEYYMRGDKHGGATFRQYYVPSRGVILVQTDPNAWAWVRAAGNLPAALDRAAASVTPFPKPTVTGATMAGKPLAANQYRRLFVATQTTDAMPDEPDWVDLKVVTRQPSPWSTTAATLAYSPSTHVLWRGSEFVRFSSSSDASFPWAVLFGGLGGAAVVVPAAVFMRRRR
jgi:hypothetical protein